MAQVRKKLEFPVVVGNRRRDDRPRKLKIPIQAFTRHNQAEQFGHRWILGIIRQPQAANCFLAKNPIVIIHFTLYLIMF